MIDLPSVMFGVGVTFVASGLLLLALIAAGFLHERRERRNRYYHDLGEEAIWPPPQATGGPAGAVHASERAGSLASARAFVDLAREDSEVEQ